MSTGDWRISGTIATLYSREGVAQHVTLFSNDARGAPWHYIVIGDGRAHMLTTDCSCEPVMMEHNGVVPSGVWLHEGLKDIFPVETS